VTKPKPKSIFPERTRAEKTENQVLTNKTHLEANKNQVATNENQVLTNALSF